MNGFQAVHCPFWCGLPTNVFKVCVFHKTSDNKILKKIGAWGFSSGTGLSTAFCESLGYDSAGG